MPGTIFGPVVRGLVDRKVEKHFVVDRRMTVVSGLVNFGVRHHFNPISLVMLRCC